MYHMNKKQEANAFVKECITTAFLQMLIEQPFEKISVSELVKKAGVGRVSLYRNFESKEEVPRKHLKTILEKWAASHENISEHELVEAIFEHYYECKELYILLYNRGLSHINLQSVKDACDPKPEQSNAAAYMSAFLRSDCTAGSRNGSKGV